MNPMTAQCGKVKVKLEVSGEKFSVYKITKGIFLKSKKTVYEGEDYDLACQYFWAEVNSSARSP